MPTWPPLHRALLFAGLLAALAASLLLAVCWGSLPLSLAEAVQGVQMTWRGEASLAGSVLALRLERALVAVCTGASLALSGALMQLLMRNPLADPYVLGLSGGAAVGALLPLLLGCAAWLVDAGALVGALTAAALVALLAWRSLYASAAAQGSRLLLTGVVLAAGWGALVTLMLSLAPDGQLRSMVFWLMGDLAGAEWRWPLLLVLALTLALLLPQSRALNVLALGPQMAQALGAPLPRLRWLLFGCGSLLTASAVTAAGSIGFVGLIIPHACRLALGNDQRVLLPAATLAGGVFLLLADTLARTLLAPQQLPVGVMTALIGVPVFLWQLAGDQTAARGAASHD